MAVDPFIDDIYEAAVVPEKWQSILDRLAEMADAEGTLLFAAGPGVPRWLSSNSIEEMIEEWIGSKWYLDNPRGQRLVPIDEPRFLTDLDALTIEEMNASDFYTELLRPRGLGWCVGTSIRSPAGDTLVFSIEKAHNKGPVPRSVAEKLDDLRPHLARASILSARLGLDRARSTITTLEAIGLPAAALAPTGRVISANAGFLASESRVRVGAGTDSVCFRPGAGVADGSNFERRTFIDRIRPVHSGAGDQDRPGLCRTRRPLARWRTGRFHRSLVDRFHHIDGAEHQPCRTIAASAV